MTFLNEFNISLNIKSDALINPSFNFDELLSESSTLDVIYTNGEKDKRFDEKIKLFLKFTAVKSFVTVIKDQRH
ncbi:hypothetical protein PVAND_016754 [Polypedilum vanderplanki]|uniref:Uncharacterized protein n=1 Tax=Polypedilum vanderplanki TaxID=319348 RepID=A0A9J6BGX3_POLVA|nr:hypothetical protein PVAND_016754 [Polypedilum vanderplanki]